MIDGGGLRGLGCLLILDRIMKAAAARSGQRLRPCEVFDLVCGTSTGGLIAILLGRLGLECDTAIDEYKLLAKTLSGPEERIFWANFLTSPDPIVETHEAKAFERALEKLVAKYGGLQDLPISTVQNLPTQQSTKVLRSTTQRALSSLFRLFSDFRNCGLQSSKLQ